MIESEAAAAYAELLENVVATAQRLLKAEKDKSKITPKHWAPSLTRPTKIRGCTPMKLMPVPSF